MSDGSADAAGRQASAGLLARMRPQQRDKCIATMRVSDYHAGQVIIEEGSIGTTMVSLLLCMALRRACCLPFDAGAKLLLLSDAILALLARVNSTSWTMAPLLLRSRYGGRRMLCLSSFCAQVTFEGFPKLGQGRVVNTFAPSDFFGEVAFVATAASLLEGDDSGRVQRLVCRAYAEGRDYCGITDSRSRLARTAHSPHRHGRGKTTLPLPGNVCQGAVRGLQHRSPGTQADT